MGWSTGKTRGAVKRLEEEGLIKIEKSLRNGRAVDLVMATPWQEMLTPEELDEFKKMEILEIVIYRLKAHTEILRRVDCKN